MYNEHITGHHRGDCTEIAPVSVVPASEKILVHQRCNPKILMQALYETGESERMICRWGAPAGGGYKYQHGAKMEQMGGSVGGHHTSYTVFWHFSSGGQGHVHFFLAWIFFLSPFFGLLSFRDGWMHGGILEIEMIRTRTVIWRHGGREKRRFPRRLLQYGGGILWPIQILSDRGAGG